MFRILIAGVLLLGLAGAAHGASPSFSARVTNPWFPLQPGSRYVYTGMKDGQPTRELMTVTHHVTTIGGAPCLAVDDRVFAAGKLAERTTDWYTQDSTGNVWYYGERTAELDRRGRVTSTEGSWQTGVHGARPGIFMPAQPHKGQSFRQELRLYVRGVGTVVEQTERGGSERNELVSFTVP